MGYFSNSDEGLAFESRWCNRCVHEERNGTGCHVMLVHLLFAYGATPEQEKVLDVLIPRSKDGLSNNQCSMFIDAETVKRKRSDKRQLKLYEGVV